MRPIILRILLIVATPSGMEHSGGIRLGSCVSDTMLFSWRCDSWIECHETSRWTSRTLDEKRIRICDSLQILSHFAIHCRLLRVQKRLSHQTL